MHLPIWQYILLPFLNWSSHKVATSWSLFLLNVSLTWTVVTSIMKLPHMDFCVPQCFCCTKEHSGSSGRFYAFSILKIIIPMRLNILDFTGMLAAEAAFSVLSEGSSIEVYWDLLRKSWIWEELKKARNYRPVSISFLLIFFCWI